MIVATRYFHRSPPIKTIFFTPMTAKTSTEINGNLSEHSLAEIFVQIAESGLSGSVRLNKDDNKIIIYINEGKIVYATSNSRQHRLFEFLLRDNIITKKQLIEIKDFINDIRLGKRLLEEKILRDQDLNKVNQIQIEEIFQFALSWNTGEWNFNHLIRAKEGIEFNINLHRILLEYSRSLYPDAILKKFNSENETFSLKKQISENLHLLSHEAFLLSRFEQYPITINEIQALSGLPESNTMQALYHLWLGGFLKRENWKSAFPDKLIDQIKSAKVVLKQEEIIESEDILEIPEAEEKEEIIEAETIDVYLDRLENSSTFYEKFGVLQDAPQSEIKKKYFFYAKNFHPDLFHQEAEPKLHQRIQNAFTEIAHAYEILKKDSTREAYNYKMRKELALKEKQQQQGASQNEIIAESQIQQGADNFKRGYELLIEEEFQDAIPFLARSVHFDNTNPRYHAFYGKALSSESKQKHKAEAELQTAIKLDTENAEYRIMLVDFFIKMNLVKRAEGELNRLLEKFPNNADAKAMLDSL